MRISKSIAKVIAVVLKTERTTTAEITKFMET